jgi:pimeloyl-ACP methyl ester carboxylesterase
MARRDHMTELIDSTDDVRVALHDLGGDGPPLLFLHATGFHGRCYRTVAHHLAGRFHVWAPDLRGHGDSVTPDMALPWSGMADDALAVIDHLRLTGHLEDGETIRACGHSMGGAAVLNVELRRPDTIRAAWLYEPIAFPATGAPLPANNPMATAARRRRTHFDSVDAAIDRLTGRGPFADVVPEALRDYVEYGFRSDGDGITLKASGEVEARVFEGIDLELFGRLPEIGIDVTIVGSGDGGNPAQIAPLIAEALPRGRLDLWSDRGHCGPFEDPPRAAAAIIAALA